MAVCVECGVSDLVVRERELTDKRRVKFGLLWLVGAFVTGGIMLLVWLVWPRQTVTIGVDRWVECRQCGAKQP